MLRQNPGENIDAWSARVRDTAMKGAVAGVKITEREKVMKLARGLNDSFETFRSAFNTGPALTDALPTFSHLNAQLSSLESDMLARANSQSLPSALAVRVGPHPQHLRDRVAQVPAQYDHKHQQQSTTQCDGSCHHTHSDK